MSPQVRCRRHLRSWLHWRRFGGQDRARGDPQAKHGPRRSPKHTRKRQGFKAWLRRWWWVFVVVPLVAIIGVVLMVVYVYSQLELPKTPPPLQTTYVYDRDGELITTLHASVDRTIIPFSEMPKHLREP